MQTSLLGSGCPYCEHRAVLKGYNDLKTVFPDVAKTWSPKNKRKPTEVSSRSNAEVWWRCKQGHEWKARVADRTEGHGCPYCAGHRVWKGFNDLTTTHPHLISEWSDKNKDITPESITCKNRSNVWWNCKRCGNEYQAEDVSYGSNKKVWWVCEKGHTWQATIKNRVLAGSGCPYCEHRAVLKGYNDLQTLFPDVAKTWSPKNESSPSEVSPSSNKAVLWVCDKDHEWKARVADRTEGHGCPYCAGQRVWKGYNDLATTHPALMAEWSDKNTSAIVKSSFLVL